MGKINNLEKESGIYSTIVKELKPQKNCFACVIPIQTAVIQCKNIKLHSFERASPLERLTVALANFFSKITRIELYFVTGKEPDLLDKDLEKLRTEGYLEYDFPFDRAVLETNLHELETNLNDRIFIQEELDRLKQRDELKQYTITRLGQKLAQTGNKDALKEGEMDFIFLRDDHGWSSVAHAIEKFRHWKYQLISESDYVFWEAFLKKYKDQLSKTKIFRELTLSSKIGLDQPKDTFLWFIYPEMEAFLQTKRGTFQISVKELLDIPFDIYDIETVLDEHNISSELLSTNLPETSPVGVSLSLNLRAPEEVRQVFELFKDNISNKWYLDCFIKDDDVLGVYRLLLVPTSVETFEELIFSMVKRENINGALKLRKDWELEVIRYIKSLEKIGNFSGSLETIMKMIISSKHLVVTEELIEAHLRSMFGEEIVNFTIVARKGKIDVYCRLQEERFLVEYRQRKFDEEFEVAIEKASTNLFSQQYTLFLCSANENEYISAILTRKTRSKILKQSELERELKAIQFKIPKEFHFKSELELRKIISTIRGPLDDDILIAEELVEKNILNSDLIETIESYNIIERENLLFVICRVKKDIVKFVYENYLNKIPSRKIILETNPSYKTQEGITYQVQLITSLEDEANKIAILRLAKEFENRLTNLSHLGNRIKGLFENIYAESSLSLPEFDKETISQFIAEARRLTTIHLEEDEIKKDLANMFGGNSGFIDLIFDYSNKNYIRTVAAITPFGSRNASEDAMLYILGQKPSREVKTSIKDFKYRISIYPSGKEVMTSFITTRMRNSLKSSKMIWKLKDIRKRSTRHGKKINKNAKTTIELDEELNNSIIKNFRTENIPILDDFVIQSLRNICNINNISPEIERESTIQAYISVKDLECLLNNRNEIVYYPEKTIEDVINDTEFSYKVQLIPMNLQTLKALIFRRTIKNFEGCHPQRWIIKEYLLELIEKYEINDYQIDLNSLFNELLFEMKEEGLITAEEHLLNHESKILGIDAKNLELASNKSGIEISVNINKDILLSISQNSNLKELFSNLKYSNTFGSVPYQTPYTTSLKITDLDTAQTWSLLRTSSEIKGRIKTLDEIFKIYEHFLRNTSSTTQEKIKSPKNLIEELHATLGKNLLVKEYLIKEAVLVYLNGYSEIEVLPEEVFVFISKKKFKEFRKKSQGIDITPIINLNLEELGKVKLRMRSMDKNALLAVLVLSLYNYRQETDKNLQSRANQLFGELLEEASLEKKKKMKLGNEKEKLISKVLEQVKKLK